MIRVDTGVAAGAAAFGVALGVAVGVGVAETGTSGTPDCNTELVPVTAGSDSVNAMIMNAAAAPIVIFASNV